MSSSIGLNNPTAVPSGPSGGGPAPIEAYRTSGVAIAHTCYRIYPKAGTLSYVRISETVLPIGGNFEVNVKKNGATVLTGNLVITTTETASNGGYVVETGDAGKSTVTDGTFAEGDRMDIEIIAGSGNTFLGADARIEYGYANS